MTEKREATVIATAADARRLGRYVLLGEVAEGGMGRIYLARAVGAAGFEKLFALKIMHQGLAERSPELADMFLDEARINSLVRHPNVCMVHDFGEAEGVRYLVMEFMVGQTLLEVLRRIFRTAGTREHPLFWSYAARIVAEACEGLHAAHTAVDERGQPMNIIHRDISPENVFMTYNGAVKVFDFGIAKASGRRHQTQAGTFKGKFAYASPEAFGSIGLDERSDVWSMGVVLWEMLSGRALFHRESEAETLGAIFQDEIPAVSQFQPACPRELQTIVDRALARDREERYASAREMARDLNRFAIKSGEHLGTAELGEWMQGLFPLEFLAALEAGRTVAKLDTRMVDAAPRLAGTPPPGLTSQIVSRPANPAGSLYSEPTVIHPTSRGAFVDEEEETALAGSPMIEEIFAEPSADLGAPSPFDEDPTKEVDGSVARGAPSPFDDTTQPPGMPHPAHPSHSSRAIGAASPFDDPPTIEEKAPRSSIRKVLAVVLAVVALVGGVSLAVLMNDSPAPPAEGITTLPSEPPAETETATETATESETATETESESESEAETESETESETETEAEAVLETETEAETESETETARASSSRSHRDPRPRDTAPSMMRATPMAPAGEPGTVGVVAVGGWADIYEGATRLGRTPARLTLPAGRHVLTLRPADGAPVRRTVEVPPGGAVRVRVEL